MSRIAIVILADTEAHGDLGRVVNALLTVKEAKEADDEVRLIFDGAGAKWIGKLADPDHRSHALYAGIAQLNTTCQRFRCLPSQRRRELDRPPAAMDLTLATSNEYELASESWTPIAPEPIGHLQGRTDSAFGAGVRVTRRLDVCPDASSKSSR